MILEIEDDLDRCLVRRQTRLISKSYAAVYPRSNANDQTLYTLWDLLTSATPWNSQGSNQRLQLVTYLTTGKGLDQALTTVGGGAAAYSQDDASAAGVERSGDELAGAVRRCGQRRRDAVG